MTHQQIKNWLDKLKNIWENKIPDEIVNICADNYLWYETPFAKPYQNKEQILADWRGILNQENISMTYEILDVGDDFGIAHWHASFLRLPSQEEVVLDGIFKVSLDDQGKCLEFHQWVSVKDIIHQ